MVDLFNGAYQNKKVLITGHTGFKGVWLTEWLLSLGADIMGISKDIPTTPSHFDIIGNKSNIKDIRCDVRDFDSVDKFIRDFQPDIIFHLAAQPLVIQSFKDPKESHTSNVLGTLNILESMRVNNINYGVLITSDKAYKNVEWCYGYKETDELGGYDPYSASKGAAELIIRSYQKSYFCSDNKSLVAVRAGNVIGGGDWAKDRIVPDIVRSWGENKAVRIRSPRSTRPWQHVLEPLSGYLLCGAKILGGNKISDAYNFGPTSEMNATVEELIEITKRYWLNNAGWLDESEGINTKESQLLKLNCDLALSDLKWKATLTLEETIKMTSDWYVKFLKDKSLIKEITKEQIKFYCKLVKERTSYV